MVTIAMLSFEGDNDDSSDSGGEVEHDDENRSYTQEQIERVNENKIKFHALVNDLASRIVSRLEEETSRLNGTGEEIKVSQSDCTDEPCRVIFQYDHAHFKFELDFFVWDFLDNNAHIHLWTTLSIHEKGEKKCIPDVRVNFLFEYIPNIALENISTDAITLRQYITETSKRIVLYDALQSIDKINDCKFKWSKKHATIYLGVVGTVQWLHLELCISDSEDAVLQILYKEWCFTTLFECKTYTMNQSICSKEEFIQYINEQLGVRPLRSQLLDLEHRIDALRLTT